MSLSNKLFPLSFLRSILTASILLAASAPGARFGGPGVIDSGLSQFRTFEVTEKVNLQARAEAFDISNTPPFANPNGNANSGNFGRITATQPAGAFGRSREFRFGLRLGF